MADKTSGSRPHRPTGDGLPGRRPGRGRPRDTSIDGAILDATVRLLGMSNLSDMTVDGVAAAAGVSKVTVYSRYRSKDALVAAALSHLQVGVPPAHSGDTEDDLVAALRSMREQYDEVGGMRITGTCLASENDDPGLLAAIRTSTLWPRRQTFGDIFQQAIDRGDLPVGTDIERGISMLIGSFYADYLAGRPFAADWERSIVRTTLAGLRATS